MRVSSALGIATCVLMVAHLGACGSSGASGESGEEPEVVSMPTISVANASVTEGNAGSKSLIFPVSLSAPTHAVVTVDYETSNGTAQEGSDYTTATGTLAIPPGATSGSIPVTISCDTDPEDDETLLLTLSDPSGATLGAAAIGTGTLLNDDAAAPTANKLLISEVSVQPSGAEYVEIYNPTVNMVDLEHYWLTDYATYYEITTATAPASSDFIVHFPPGAQIVPGGALTIAVGSATDFLTAFGTYPDFVLAGNTSTPQMLGQGGGSASLTNGGEMLMLFFWDGTTAQVTDVDYVLWGSTTSATDKTGVGSYLPDTDPALQDPAISPEAGQSIERAATLSEGVQTPSGGNGLTGADETSEDFSNTFLVGTPTPGISPDL